jgi:hypothetical protein
MRGEAPADMAAIEETIQRVSQLVGEHPEIIEMDINPFVVLEEGGIVVDAHRIGGQQPRRDGGSGCSRRHAAVLNRRHGSTPRAPRSHPGAGSPWKSCDAFWQDIVRTASGSCRP